MARGTPEREPFRLAPAASSTARAASASPSTAGAMPAIPATRWPRRCSPTACVWSAARSNITGRAASSAPAPEEPNALVDVRTARGASRTRAPPRSSSTTASTPRARTAGRRSPSTSAAVNQLVAPFFGAGFYYKTFMWPAHVLGARLRAVIRRSRRARPRRRREPDPDHYEKAFAFCDVLVIGAGPAGPHGGARPRAAPARASSSPRRISASAAGSRRALRRSTASPPRTGRAAAARRARGAATMCGSCRARPSSASTTAAPMARSSASPITCRVPPEHSRASAPGTSRQSAPCSPPAPSSAASSSPATIGPASCWRRRCATYLNRFGVAPGDARRASSPTPTRLAHGADLAACRRRGRRRGRSARSRAASRQQGAGPRPRLRRRRGERGARRPAAQERRSSATARASRPRSPATCSPCPAAGIPTLHLTCHLGGKPVWHEALAAFVPGRPPQGMASAGAAAGHLSLPRRSHDGARPAREAARDCGFAASVPPHAAGRRRRARRVDAALAGAWRQGRRPSSISRTTSPPRTSSLPRARVRRRRAPQALHHTRHGAPTRARPRNVDGARRRRRS